MPFALKRSGLAHPIHVKEAETRICRRTSEFLPVTADTHMATAIDARHFCSYLDKQDFIASDACVSQVKESCAAHAPPFDGINTGLNPILFISHYPSRVHSEYQHPLSQLRLFDAAQYVTPPPKRPKHCL